MADTDTPTLPASPTEPETALAVVVPADSILAQILDTRKGASRGKLPETLQEVRKNILTKQYTDDVALFHRALAVYDAQHRILMGIRADLEPEFDEHGKELIPKRFSAKQHKSRGEQKARINTLITAINKAGTEGGAEIAKLIELLKKYEGSSK